MSRAIFLLLAIGVLVSVTSAYRSPPQPPASCPQNQEWNSCGSACPPSCNSPDPHQPCTLQCVIGCQCKPGFLLNSSGQCVSPSSC